MWGAFTMTRPVRRQRFLRQRFLKHGSPGRSALGHGLLSLGVLLLATGCGGGKSSSDAAPAASDAAPAAMPAAGDFVKPSDGTNKWLPLKAGTQWTREGTTLIGKRAVAHKVTSTVTDVIREINGVKAVLVLDEETGAGQVVDKSLDYLAVDNAGNVWWLGGVTEEYADGKFAGVDEAWLDGKKGGKAGILLPADPTSGTAPWTIAAPPGEKGDQASFLEKRAEECVPFDCYKDVLVVSEGTGAETELKYYAQGVGQIRNEPKKSHDEDNEKLVNVTQLSADGLSEASKEALRMDAGAAKEETDTFGDIKAARAT